MGKLFTLRRIHGWLLIAGLSIVAALAMPGTDARANPATWKFEWTKTDFSRHSVKFDEIMSGGPGKDGIPAIDKPRFVPIQEMTTKKWIGDTEPVISVEIAGDRRAYPLRLLIWHEIVNDTVGGVPVTVTYCPLCNSAIVFDRRIAGRILDFGTTGKLRNSDLVMYDRQTESWWQQFMGEAIIGDMTGTRLKMLPARVESFARFRDRAPDGKVLVPTGDVRRNYGANPYRGYDTSARPFLYGGEMPKGIKPLAYVLAIGDHAWSLDLLRREKRIEFGKLVISWTPGQNSALDHYRIGQGRDIGNIVVQRRTANGMVDAVHDLTFAFVFHAFRPGGTLHK
ncbi:MAG: DUF3179 domain-containing protein [Alphaproteobacteria bacterium]